MARMKELVIEELENLSEKTGYDFEDLMEAMYGPTRMLSGIQSPQFGWVRTLTGKGVALFCGEDVAAALGYQAPSKAVADHCKGAEMGWAPTSGGRQALHFIPETDVSRLVSMSALPEAAAFAGWIFEEVLPSIRKSRRYTWPEGIQDAVRDLTASWEEDLYE